jgi:hypothetical protein
LAVIALLGNLALLGASGFLVVLWIISMRASKIEVTPMQVLVTSWFTARRQASRQDIRTMHWFSTATVFEGEGHSKLLRIPGGGWTRGQLLDISEALGVPLYDHRKRSGMSDVTKGRLVQRADAAPR